MLHGLDIESREPVLGGRSFGAVGPYEQIHGSARFRLDPDLVVNTRIVDLALAPRDDQGFVHCRADLWLLHPLAPARGNGALFYHVVNRGRKGLLSTFQLAVGSNRPVTRLNSATLCSWNGGTPSPPSAGRPMFPLTVPTTPT
jgi:hypothetical protein